MKEKILEYLKEAQGYVSGQELCERLGVSRTAVWKNIKLLEGEGYCIEAVKNRGYHLVDVPDSIDPMELHGYIHTKWLGHSLYTKDSVDSTNNWAKRMAEEGAPNGTVVIANEQTQGKGRRGRHWTTPPGATVALTKLLRPDMPPERASMITLVEGLSVAQTINQLYGLNAMIKWPNDVVVSGKKICGILTEMSAQVDYINYVVVGTGINTNLATIPPEIADIATSLLLELQSKDKIKRAPLIGALLETFEKNYKIFQEVWDLSGLMEAYNEILVNRNNQVKVLEPGNEYTGVARGITPMGHLLVEDDHGNVAQVYAGEVSVRGLYGYV